MKTISILLGLTGFIVICASSFDYVEGHESTKVKKELEEHKQEIERISGDAKVLNQKKIDVEERLTRACRLLAAADIFDGGICDEEELEEGERPDAVGVTDICSLPGVIGPCEAYTPRLYYSAVTGQCESFIYGGCDGNANNFQTLEECEAACVQTALAESDAENRSDSNETD